MRLAWWMAVHEARIQLRSYRFRILAALYLPITIAAPVALHLTESGFARRFGPGIWGACVEASLPLFTVLFAWVVSGDAILREQDENSFLVASLGVRSNSAYLFARWLAVTAIVSLVSIVPLVVTMVMGARGDNGVSAVMFAFVQWLVVVVPLVMMTTALSMGISTIVGSAVGGTLLTVFGGIFGLAILQGLLARIGRTIDGPLEWLRFERPFDFVSLLAYRWATRRAIYTDTPFDWRTYVELALPRGAVILTFSVFLIVAAGAFLRRTRPNHRVWRIGDRNPVRTYLRALRSMYERLTPDAGLQVFERVAIVGTFLLVVGSFGAVFRLDGAWRRLAEDRASVERASWPEPTSVNFVAERVAIDGELDGGSGLDANIVVTMRNAGSEKVSRLAATLNPMLEVSSEMQGLTVQKQWDRVEFRLARPVEPGERVDLALRVRGMPADLRFVNFPGDDFAGWYARTKEARVEHYVQDFSRSIREELVSARRIVLQGSSLLPVPRVMPWGEEDRSVQFAEIEVDLESKLGLRLASSCGDLSTTEDGVARLAGSCRDEIRTFSVLGANWETSELSDEATLVCLDPHCSAGERRARALADALAEATRHWPDLSRGERTLIAEVPDRQEFETAVWVQRGEFAEPVTEGSMVKVTEEWLMDRNEAEGGQLMVALRAQALLARRSIDPEQNYFFRHFYGTLAAAELGYVREAGAVLGQTQRIQYGLLYNRPWDPIWTQKLPAIFEAVRYRIGTKALLDGVEDFLNAGGAEPANAQGLFHALELRSGVSLAEFFRDFVMLGKLPKLQLVDVTFVRQGTTWVVDGAVANDADGQAICPVVLRTEIATMTTDVTVDSGASDSFHFETRHRPVKVELDPDHRCFRWEPRTTIREVVNKVGNR